MRTVTISAEQRDLASRRVRERGWPTGSASSYWTTGGLDGQYDADGFGRMIEAVAVRYWAEYFAVLDRPSPRAAGSACRR